MKTMGLSRLVLVAPQCGIDDVARARASGASDVLDSARIAGTLTEALQGCVMAAGLTARRRELSAPVAEPREAAAELARTALQGEVAVVFGNETFGLENRELEMCGLVVTIPASRDYSSLNLAASVQVMCYELRLALVPSMQPEEGRGEAATHEEVERLIRHFEQAAVASGFLDPAVPRRLMARLRRLFARARLEREEVNILRGLLGALETKVDKNNRII